MTSSFKAYLNEHWIYLTKPGLYPGIDISRALAISLVLLFHFRCLPFGWIGVDLFFVISGFLIGGIIIDKILANRFSLFEFYRNRALRILPVYYTMILLSYLFRADAKPLNMLAFKTIAVAAVFLQAALPYFLPHYFVLDQSLIPGGTWSLAIEEMFYLFAPITFILLLNKSHSLNKIIRILGLISLAAIGWRFFMTRGFAADDPNWHFASFIQFYSRYDELLAGVITAMLIRNFPNLRRGAEGFAIAAIVLFLIFLAFMLAHPVYLTLPQTLTRDTMWLPTLLGVTGASFLLSIYWVPCNIKWVIILARLSYPLYLMHIFICQVVMHIPGLMDKAQLYMGIYVVYLLIVFASIVCSWLLSFTVEYPFIRIYKNPAFKKEASLLQQPA